MLTLHPPPHMDAKMVLELLWLHSFADRWEWGL